MTLYKALPNSRVKHSFEEIDKLSYEEKVSLLRSNPVTAARHFNHRLQSFFKSFLLAPANPLGKIKHSYRIEFQQRGSPHAHSVLWTYDSPTPDDGDDVLYAFIHKLCLLWHPIRESGPIVVLASYHCAAASPLCHLQEEGDILSLWIP